MGKRYKKGNVGKARKRPNKPYMDREKEINKLIKKFRKHIFNNEINNRNNYIEADRQRRKLKRLLDVQGKQVTSQGRKRRWVYYDQLSKFKGLYVTWKKISYPTYLSVRYDFPEHLIPCLCVYNRDVHTGVKTSYNIF